MSEAVTETERFKRAEARALRAYSSGSFDAAGTFIFHFLAPTPDDRTPDIFGEPAQELRDTARHGREAFRRGMVKAAEEMMSKIDQKGA